MKFVTTYQGLLSVEQLSVRYCFSVCSVNCKL